MRVLAVFAGAFSAGIFLAQYVPLWGALILSVGAGVLLRGKRRKPVLVLCTGLFLACAYNRAYTALVVSPMTALSGTERELELTVCDYPEPASYGVRVTVRAAGLPGKLVYYGDWSLGDVQPGETVRDTVRLQDARKIRDSTVTTFTSAGVFLLAYGRGTPSVEDGTAGSLRWFPVRAGQAVRERIHTLLNGDSAAFLCAMLTGDRSGLSEQVAADLSEAGLAHLLAVSGLHTGFVYALAVLLAGNQRLAVVIGVPLMVFYALMTGAKPSVVRACVMLSLYSAAPLFRRQRDAPTAFSAALMLILLHNPYAAASVSLQLSFASVAGLIWVSPVLYRHWTGRGRVRRFIAGSLSASFGAVMFSAPLCAYYFGFLSLVSPFSSLLCLWAAGFIFLSGAAAVLLSFVCPPLAAVTAALSGLLIRFLLGAAHMLAKIPFHAVYFVNPWLWFWIALTALVFLAVRFTGKPNRRKYAAAGALSVLTLLLVLWAGRARYAHTMDAVVLNVGQGQCVALCSGGRYALADCGSGNSYIDAGAVAAAQLRTMGCGQLDLLLLTHYDSDHVNGAEALLSRIRVRQLLLPEPPDDNGLQGRILDTAERYGVPVRYVTDRETVLFGDGTLTVFPPVGGSGDNDRGLSLLASAGESDLLITGDMGQSAEKALMSAYDLPDLEGLVAGHHGSKSSTSDALLDTLKPETVCVSVGSNSYGHPAPETLSRLDEHGCTVYRTDRDGNIHLIFP